MRAHGLLAPRRLGPPNGDPAHAGTITTRPDEMWGTDATASTPSRTAGAGSSGPSITRSTRSWAGIRPRSAIGGLRWSRSARACATLSAPSARRSRAACACGVIGAAVHRRRLDQRSEVARHHDLAVVRRRAGVEQRGGTLHADAEGAVPLPAPLHVAGRGADDHQ